MKLSRLATLWQLPFQSVLTASPGSGSSVSIASNAPPGAPVVPRDLVSFSIEYRHLPKFTGSLDEPNEFSQNLLDNLQSLTGRYPLIRVGGGSQDFAYFNASQSAAEVDLPGVPAGQSGGGPTASLGEKYFDSFQVWSDLKFIVGINLGFYNDDGIESLEHMVKYTCQALGDRLVMWENGNEPDLLPNWGQRNSSNWTIPAYVGQWKDFSSRIVNQARKSCGNSYNRPFYGPSIATVSNDPFQFTDVAAFNAGINNDSKTHIAQIATHSYMGFGGSASLQASLMSHDKVKSTIARHLELQSDLARYGLTFTIGEGNSLTGGGQANVSDVFGAALWAADYSLYVASVADRIKRTHFHQSYGRKGSPYNAWTPIPDDFGGPTTNAPYYGHLLAAKTIGSEEQGRIFEVVLPETDGLDSMYVAYDSDGPKRITVLNMKEFNGYNHRNNRTYAVKLPSADFSFRVERLQAACATVKNGITFGGRSYDYDSLGKAQSASSTIQAASAAGVTQDGDTLTVNLPDSEAVLITLIVADNSDTTSK